MARGTGGDGESRTRRELLGLLASAGGIVGSGCLNRDAERSVEPGGTDPTDPDGEATAGTPSVRWRHETDGRVWGSPVVADGRLYVSNPDGHVYALAGEEVDGAVEHDCAMFKQDRARTNAPSTEGPTDGVVRDWRFPTGGRVFAAPALVDGRLYFGSEDNYLYAVDATGGDELWRLDVGKRFGGAGSPVVRDRVVYYGAGNSGSGRVSDIGEGGVVGAVDAEDGTRRWSVELDEGVQSPPVVDDGTLYHGCQDHRFYARDAATGEERWSLRGEGQFCACGPAVRDGTVYVGSLDGRLYAVDGDTGTVEWRFATEDEVASTPVATEEAVYVGSKDGNLYGVDRRTGEELWRYPTGGVVFSSPAYRDGTVYVGASNGVVAAVDAAGGRPRWTFETEGNVSSSPVVTGDTVYVGSDDRAVYALTREADPA